jgi:hypothetical protein
MNSGIATQIPVIETQIKSKELTIQDLDKQIAVIDDAIKKLIDSGKSENALKNNEKQTSKRDELVKRKEKETADLVAIKSKKIELESELRKVEAEVGPIKYIAELFYDTSDAKLLDKAVRGVIIILIIVFDPLAIFLLIAFNISMKRKEEGHMEFLEIPKSFREPKKTKISKPVLRNGDDF